MNNLLLYNALIPNYSFQSNILLNFNKKSNVKKMTEINDFYEYILSHFNNTNKINGLTEELNNDVLLKINNLHYHGIEFDFSVINIAINDIIFPLCDIGKNRSQFIFYYLKSLQSIKNNTFLTGYPMSCDELTTLFKDNNNSILSGFQVPYKSDSFSNSMLYVFNKEYSRSIHVFDKILKEKEDYIKGDISNLESHKYKNHIYDIFDKDKDYIKELFINYYLNPLNIKKILNDNLNINETKMINYRITYLCMSPMSFINLCDIFYKLKQENNKLDLTNVKIIYFGITDIFQRSSINKHILNNFIEQINDFIHFSY